ncbi:MAG: hypothetical protein ACPG5B_09785 [Chitinophagales bacterium]
MAINKYKIEYLAQKAQVVVFTNRGKLIETCDALLHISIYKSESLFEVFPFLESLQESLTTIEVGKELYFPRVEYNYRDQDWVFDFTFYRSTHNANHIVWVIQNFTKLYQHLMLIQQERNEAIIKNQRLKQERQFDNIKQELETFNNIIQAQTIQLQSLAQNVEQPLHEIKHIIQQQFSSNHINPKTTTQLKALVKEVEEQFEKIPASLEHIQLQTQHFLLPEILWSVLKTLHYDESAIIKFNVLPNVPKRLKGDYLKLCQILHNTISNLLIINNKSEILVTVKPTKKEFEFCELQFNISLQELEKTKAEIAKTINRFQLQTPVKDDIDLLQENIEISKQLVKLQAGNIKVIKNKTEMLSIIITLPFGL